MAACIRRQNNKLETRLCSLSLLYLHLKFLMYEVIKYFSILAVSCSELAEPISVSLYLQAVQLFSKKCRRGEALATLFPMGQARGLNLRPPAPETNALPLDQLADWTNATE